MTVLVISENGRRRPMHPNVAGDLDAAPGVFGVDGPDVCRDRCAMADVEHTEDQCTAVTQ